MEWLNELKQQLNTSRQEAMFSPTFPLDTVSVQHMVITGTLACLNSSESQELEEEHLRLMEMQQEEDELLHSMLVAAMEFFQLPGLCKKWCAFLLFPV